MKKEIPASGRELAEDLAAERRLLGDLAFTEIELPGTELRIPRNSGAYVYDGASRGRVDVVSLKPRQYANFSLVVYEVKTSKADFKVDDAAQKWRRYLRVCHRLFFAAPQGVLEKKDVPAEAGLIVRSEKGWSVVKAAPIHVSPPDLSIYTILAMLFQKSAEERQMRRLRDRIIAEDNVPILSQAKHLGIEIAKRLSEKCPVAEQENRLQIIVNTLKENLGIDIESDFLYKPDEKIMDAIRIIGTLSRYCEAVAQTGEFLSALGCAWKANRIPPELVKTKTFIEGLLLPAEEDVEPARRVRRTAGRRG